MEYYLKLSFPFLHVRLMYILTTLFFQVDWTLLIPRNWSGPIVVRSSEYLKAIHGLLTKYSTRVAHNSIIVLFVLGILPQDRSSPIVCTRATMWALPDMSSALFVAQYSIKNVNAVVKRVSIKYKYSSTN